MAKYILLYGVVMLAVSLIVVHIAKGAKTPPAVPCDSCKYLIRKGGLWKYYCNCQKANEMGFTHHFDTAPEYCGLWEPRKENDDA